MSKLYAVLLYRKFKFCAIQLNPIYKLYKMELLTKSEVGDNQ
jgi:hypothetical protein